MATYVISDIHGSLTEFKKLLRKIDFEYDGRDQLYVLGDYVDWGPDSIETVQYLMRLSRHAYVHCLMGNHDLMFLQTIRNTLPDGEPGLLAGTWLYANRGLDTWEQYRRLPTEEQSAIARWLSQLPYSAVTSVEGKTYMLAHAFPYHYDMSYDPSEIRKRREDAVWRRLMLREDPFGEYTGETRYDRLICGHTVTRYYYDQLRYVKDWPFRKPERHKRNRIFVGERFTDIDCGAKCLYCEEEVEPLLREAAARAQLACLRLEDGKVFYVRRPETDLPVSEEDEEPDEEEYTWRRKRSRRAEGSAEDRDRDDSRNGVQMRLEEFMDLSGEKDTGKT